MKKVLSVGGVAVIAFAGFLGLILFLRQQKLAKISSYDECVSAGLPIMESFPPRCQVPNGKTYTKDIGNGMEMKDEIIVTDPLPSQKIISPLVIQGKARGRWFFEGSFSGELFDSQGKSLGVANLNATGNWMTTDFVEFSGSMRYEKSLDRKGTLIIKNANPSGLPDKEKKLTIPVEL